MSKLASASNTAARMSVHCSPSLVSRSRAAAFERFALVELMIVAGHFVSRSIDLARRAGKRRSIGGHRVEAVAEREDRDADDRVDRLRCRRAARLSAPAITPRPRPPIALGIMKPCSRMPRPSANAPRIIASVRPTSWMHRRAEEAAGRGETAPSRTAVARQWTRHRPDKAHGQPVEPGGRNRMSCAIATPHIIAGAEKLQHHIMRYFSPLLARRAARA